MADLPSNLGFGFVTGRFVNAIADGPDPDRMPDAQAATGTITFTPTVSRILNPGATPDPVTILPKPITVSLDSEGYIIDSQNARGVYLVATNDPDGNPTDWQYSVQFSLNGSTVSPFFISVPEGSVIDMTLVQPVPSAPGIVTVVSESSRQAAEAAADRAEAAAERAEEAAEGGGGGGQGPPGPPGPSAYDVAVENGFVGTEQQWLDSLQGEPGEDGAPGAPGATTIDGIAGLQDALDDRPTVEDVAAMIEAALTNRPEIFIDPTGATPEGSLVGETVA